MYPPTLSGVAFLTHNNSRYQIYPNISLEYHNYGHISMNDGPSSLMIHQTTDYGDAQDVLLEF